MGIIRSRANVEENEESQLKGSYPTDDTKFSKPLHKKLCLPWIDTPADREDESESESDSDSGQEEENLSSRDTNDNRSQSESEGATESMPEREDQDLGANEAEGEAKLTLLAQEKAKGSVSPNCYEADPKKEQNLSKSITAKGKEPLESEKTQPERRVSERANTKSGCSKAMVLGANGGKKPSKRVWNENDEIVILEGMIKLKKKNVPKPNGTVESLLCSIGNSLHFQPTVDQLERKIRGLKQNYERNAGKPHPIGKSHEAKVFKLSRRVWGVEPENELSRDNHNGEQPHCSFKSSEIPRGDCGSKAKKKISKERSRSVDASPKPDLGEQWTKQRINETRLYIDRLDMMKKTLDEVIKAVEASLRTSESTDLVIHTTAD